VATEDDPNTARLGESFYRFLPRAWIGSFVAGFEIETQMMRQKSPRPPRWRHPYVVYIVGALFCLAIATLAGGLFAYLALVAYAQTQLMLSDYVQHYGLMRQRLASGKPEPVGPQHSWNAPHWFSGYLLLNAPRHSDHHAHPSKPYPALDLPDPKAAPTLPRSLPAMAAIALYPKLWKRVMTPRAIAWSKSGTHDIAATSSA
jgi:alkane 1-monooxygenase